MDEERLGRIRDRIDAVDVKLIELVAQRIALVDEARALKAAHGLPIYDRAREAVMMDERARWAAARGVATDAARALFDALLVISRGPL